MEATAVRREPADLETLTDHDLLAGGLFDQIEENFFAAQRLARLDEFRCRLERDFHARRARREHFTLTPLQETVIEAGELWGLGAERVRTDLQRVRVLKRHFPGVWDLCLHGQLDTYKASLIADAACPALDAPDKLAQVARAITAWLRRGIPDDDDRPPLVNRTARQLRNKLNYEMKKVRPKDSDEAFKRAFKGRGVRTRLNEDDGMGALTIGNSVNQIQLADYRLSLVAKFMRSNGDKRTLDQLRSDLAIDLILGQLEVNASIRELCDADTGECALAPHAAHRLPISNYARPIVNVTVPLQTLMGTSDQPGVLSGGTVIPAVLARQIASDPNSTWYRMLTDQHGHCLELSTTSYRPTAPIWRDVVGRYGSCFRRNCTTPATTCELDHRVPYPRGTTSTGNLEPACKRDHKGKHAEGFALYQNEDGTLTYSTAAGFRHRTEQLQHPICKEWPAGDLFEVQLSASEFIDALQRQRDQDAAIENNLSAAYEEEKLWACYRASYPNASDEDLHYWIHGSLGEPEEDHAAPPILTEAYTPSERMALDNLWREERQASA
jgi:hypothetical protein